MTGMDEVYALKDECEKAQNDMFAAENRRDGIAWMDARIRYVTALEKIKEYKV